MTTKEKQLLENKIYNIIKESMFESDLYEKKKKHHYDDEDDYDEDDYDEDDYDEDDYDEDDYDEDDEDHNDDSDDKNTKEAKRDSIMKWLDTAQELHSVLSYELWPDMDEDSARSLFSKKFRGEDADGKPYDFNDDEVNTLYNMKDAFIEDIS